MEAMKKSANRGLLVANGWIQAVAIVVVFGFFVLGLLAYRTYKDEPPIPARTVGEAGDVAVGGIDCAGDAGLIDRRFAEEVHAAPVTRNRAGAGV
jgi:hypothetical protein